MAHASRQPKTRPRPHRGHAWNGFELANEPFVESKHLRFAVVARFGNPDAERNHALGFESRVDRGQSRKALAEK